MEIKDPNSETRRLRQRLGFAMGLAIVCFGLLVARFYFLQVLRYDAFHAQAEDNRITVVPIPPQRGQITDRNGIVLAENVFSYALEVAPGRVENLDRTIDELSRIIDITATDKRRFRRLLAELKFTDTLPLKTRLTDEEVARLAAVRFRFPGVEVRARSYRNYPLGRTASHVIGHIGRISLDDKERLTDEGKETAYAGSTHIGKLGVELSYEDVLHGRPGIEEVEVSAGGRALRSLSRKPPQAGSNLQLSIDIRLQKLIENWYGERRGALVAIEPSSGDVIAMVSSPTFDPNLFVDGIDAQSWRDLNTDPDKPMLNRPLRGTYPPGSTYKPFMALAVLKTGVRRPEYAISDPGFYTLGDHRFRDSKAGGNGSVNLQKAIVVSSDTYFYGAAYEMGVDRIHDFMDPWGFGRQTGIDLRDEAVGILPSSAWKRKRYKLPWLPGETPSIGIGQGYNNFTILQLAHATATLANNGTIMKPHVVRQIENSQNGETVQTVKEPSGRIDVTQKMLDFVRNAMVGVTTVGTGRSSFVGAGYAVAGKTGTAQVIGIRQNEKYDARKIAERHRDHSLFMAFAPADNPRIALALIVENGGFGAQAAAPIARKVFDYYLQGKLPDDTEEPFRDPVDPEELRDVPALPDSEGDDAAHAAAEAATMADGMTPVVDESPANLWRAAPIVPKPVPVSPAQTPARSAAPSPEKSAKAPPPPKSTTPGPMPAKTAPPKPAPAPKPTTAAAPPPSSPRTTGPRPAPMDSNR